MMYDAEDKYADIIHLPHHVSRNHPQMSMADRAAQFSPFAALTGHDAAISEAARLTDERPIPDESVEQDIFQILCLGIMIKCDVFLFHTQINYPSLRCNPPIALNSHVDEVIK